MSTPAGSSVTRFAIRSTCYCFTSSLCFSVHHSIFRTYCQGYRSQLVGSVGSLVASEDPCEDSTVVWNGCSVPGDHTSASMLTCTPQNKMGSELLRDAPALRQRPLVVLLGWGVERVRSASPSITLSV
eukprot:gene37059-45714_t